MFMEMYWIVLLFIHRCLFLQRIIVETFISATVPRLWGIGGDGKFFPENGESG